MSKNSTKNRRKTRKNSPKVHIESTGRNLTSQAGLIPVIKFLHKLGFSGLFNRHVHHQRAKIAQYSLVEGVFGCFCPNRRIGALGVCQTYPPILG